MDLGLSAKKQIGKIKTKHLHSEVVLAETCDRTYLRHFTAIITHNMHTGHDNMVSFLVMVVEGNVYKLHRSNLKFVLLRFQWQKKFSQFGLVTCGALLAIDRLNGSCI